jgi:hypothetical protein
MMEQMQEDQIQMEDKLKDLKEEKNLKSFEQKILMRK